MSKLLTAWGMVLPVIPVAIVATLFVQKDLTGGTVTAQEADAFCQLSPGKRTVFGDERTHIRIHDKKNQQLIASTTHHHELDALPSKDSNTLKGGDTNYGDMSYVVDRAKGECRVKYRVAEASLLEGAYQLFAKTHVYKLVP